MVPGIVLNMNRRAATALLLTAALGLTASACASSSDEASSTGAASDATGATVACPVEPIEIVVSVDQWGEIAEQLAGPCGNVTTIISGSAGDPHDYEPTTADSAAFTDADLVVVNGADYDHWTELAIETLDTAPVVVDAAEVVGRQEGENPHIWYGPEFVAQVADAIEAELVALLPGAEDVLAAQRAAWDEAIAPYDELVASISAEHAGATIASTEGVFDDMAAALGLVDATPEGYRAAAANEVDPSPGDVAAFEEVLTSGGVDVLIFNSQTEGAIPDQIRSVAETAGVPVVEVTETIAPGADGFLAWQIAQLEALADALAA